MNKADVLSFLKDNRVFYIATVDGDKPAVRPFGFVMDFEDKLYFCTNNKKDVFKQLQVNPHFELSAAGSGEKWLRLSGKAVINTTRAVKEAALQEMPFLKNIYSVDDDLFELFYLAEGEASFRSVKGDILDSVKL